jgi:leucyl aminopeptidase (aminopeptidase T)
MREKKIYKACQTLLTVCSHCQKDENILIVTDEDCMDMGLALWDAAEEFPNRTLILMNTRQMHGEEPTPLVAAAMLKADVIFRATKLSLSHSTARIKACEAGARDLNCCDYDYRMLESGGLYTDFEANRKYVDQIAKGFKDGDVCEITSALGTNYKASIKGHKIFPQYGMTRDKGRTSSPPDIECATGAMPYTANGVVYIDGSITHPRIGVIEPGKPIRVEIKDSFVTNISGGEQADILRDVLEKINDHRIYQIGEIGVGLNPDATITGRMLEDEGCYGTVHVALGNNESGNDINLHIDMMFRNPTIKVDGKVILDVGQVVFD